jgi:hypothetical protein
MTTTSQFTPAPRNDAVVEEGRHPGPQRLLDARLADAIREGKERTGLSWRGLAAETGVSRAHLHNLASGRRVPSQRVAGILVNTLDLNYEIADGLRAVAAPNWRERLDRWPGGLGVPPYPMGDAAVPVSSAIR